MIKGRPHLGEYVAFLLEKRGMSKAEFGRRIKTSRQNVSLILQKQDFHTDQIWLISKALEVNLFAYIADSFDHHYNEKTKGAVSEVAINLKIPDTRLLLALTNLLENAALRLEASNEQDNELETS